MIGGGGCRELFFEGLDLYDWFFVKGFLARGSLPVRRSAMVM